MGRTAVLATSDQNTTAIQSGDVVAEIAGFRYKNDARLFPVLPRNPGVLARVSTGSFWTVRDE